jgi:hypothetical protein
VVQQLEILLCVNCDRFEVIAWEIKNFSISAIHENKVTVVIVRTTTVYGSLYEEKKMEFMSELYEILLNWESPIGGNFNFVRTQEDKNSGNMNFNWVDNFNSWVDM